MFNEQVLFQEIQKLPKNLKEEVSSFVQTLKQKHSSLTETSEEPKPRKKRKARSAKGMFVLTEAFNEPLEDFAEYM